MQLPHTCEIAAQLAQASSLHGVLLVYTGSVKGLWNRLGTLECTAGHELWGFTNQIQLQAQKFTEYHFVTQNRAFSLMTKSCRFNRDIVRLAALPNDDGTDSCKVEETLLTALNS